MTRRPMRRNERGLVAGGDAVVFGALILLAGTLVVTNLWSIVETRTAVDAAARDYLRSYTRAENSTDATRLAEQAARAVLDGRGTPLTGLEITPPDPGGFGPCGTATVTLAARVPAARVPFLGELGATEVTVTHTELIDAHRAIDPHDRFDPATTACGQG